MSCLPNRSLILRNVRTVKLIIEIVANIAIKFKKLSIYKHFKQFTNIAKSINVYQLI